MPTTAVELVAAPGANKMLMLVGAAVLRLDWTADYTNINAAALGQLVIGNRYAAIPFLQSQSDLSDLLAPGGDSIAIASPRDFLLFDNAGTPDTHPNGGNAPVDFANLPLRLNINNDVSGNLTGGNAANVLYVTLIYTVVDV